MSGEDVHGLRTGHRSAGQAEGHDPEPGNAQATLFQAHTSTSDGVLCEVVLSLGATIDLRSGTRPVAVDIDFLWPMNHGLLGSVSGLQDVVAGSSDPLRYELDGLAPQTVDPGARRVEPLGYTVLLTPVGSVPWGAVGSSEQIALQVEPMR